MRRVRLTVVADIRYDSYAISPGEKRLPFWVVKQEPAQGLHERLFWSAANLNNLPAAEQQLRSDSRATFRPKCVKGQKYPSQVSRVDDVTGVIGLAFRSFLIYCSDVPVDLSEQINKRSRKLSIGQELHAAMLWLSKNCSNWFALTIWVRDRCG